MPRIQKTAEEWADYLGQLMTPESRRRETIRAIELAISDELNRLRVATPEMCMAAQRNRSIELDDTEEMWAEGWEHMFQALSH